MSTYDGMPSLLSASTGSDADRVDFSAPTGAGNDTQHTNAHPNAAGECVIAHAIYTIPNVSEPMVLTVTKRAMGDTGDLQYRVVLGTQRDLKFWIVFDTRM